MFFGSLFSNPVNLPTGFGGSVQVHGLHLVSSSFVYIKNQEKWLLQNNLYCIA